jgi:hypothetical protein
MSTVQATNLKHGSSASNNIVLDASGNAAFAGAVTVAGNATITGTLQANGVTGSVYPLVLGTAQASTSGTSIDFTGIPSWVRRVTIMFIGVSTNGSSNYIVQIGAGSVDTTGYLSGAGGGAGSANATNGFILTGLNAATTINHGLVTLCTAGSNTWVCGSTLGRSETANFNAGGGSKTLAGTLDRVRITTAGGTDTFDAGSINLLWE